jgi:DNA uptake protein ComE-like DNA-binding protein
MRWLPKCLLMTVLLATSAVAFPGVCQAQLRQQPSLLVQLWPLFRSSRPVVLLPHESRPVTELQRPLVAPFVPRKLDINSASFEEIQNLPGITSSMAARIFAGRPYRNRDDLLRDGIPLNVVQSLTSQIEFGP